jgi:hypothetical protein
MHLHGRCVINPTGRVFIPLPLLLGTPDRLAVAFSLGENAIGIVPRFTPTGKMV